MFFCCLSNTQDELNDLLLVYIRPPSWQIEIYLHESLFLGVLSSVSNHTFTWEAHLMMIVIMMMIDDDDDD